MSLRSVKGDFRRTARELQIKDLHYGIIPQRKAELFILRFRSKHFTRHNGAFHESIAFISFVVDPFDFAIATLRATEGELGELRSL